MTKIRVLEDELESVRHGGKIDRRQMTELLVAKNERDDYINQLDSLNQKAQRSIDMILDLQNDRNSYRQICIQVMEKLKVGPSYTERQRQHLIT
jgi:hypothetical protein